MVEVIFISVSISPRLRGLYTCFSSFAFVPSCVHHGTTAPFSTCPTVTSNPLRSRWANGLQRELTVLRERKPVPREFSLHDLDEEDPESAALTWTMQFWMLRNGNVRFISPLLDRFGLSYISIVDNEPLVPASSAILLTTNSKLASSSSASAIDADDNAFERYFDRPEVSAAYKKQQIIETPEYSLLSEDASVGGRFRPRGVEDVCPRHSRLCYTNS